MTKPGKNLHHHRIIHDILCLISGILLPMAFAPFNFFWLAIACPAVLLYGYTQTKDVRRAAWRGWLFGLGFFAAGTSWVFVSIHEFGQVNSFVALLLTILFVAILALFFLAQGIFLQKLFPHPTLGKLLFIFPATWVLLEWIRAWLFTGFPWLYLGYSQIHSPLSGLTPLLGTYGTSFIVLISASLLLLTLFRRGRIRKNSFIALAGIWILAAILSPIHWTHKISKALTVSLVQGNIPQSLKWNPSQVLPTLNTYRSLTEKHWADLVVWPEAAIPMIEDEAKPFLKIMSQEAKKQHSTLVVGIPTRNANNTAFYNAAVAIGNGSGHYAKRHLVPFGEYVPLQNFIGHVMQLFNVPLPNLKPGQQKQVGLNAGNIKLATFICYEIAYPNLLRTDLPQAELLLNLSNDAWFGHSFAAAQQLQIAQMRALESGRYLLASTNNGVTAIVNNKGRIVKAFPRFKRGVLTGHVFAMSGNTPWMLIGNWPVILLCFFLLGFIWFRQRQC